MERNFQVVDLVDSRNGRYLGQALYCDEHKECPFFTVNFNRTAAGEMVEAFTSGAKAVGGNINLTHINMPLEMNIYTPYEEIRNTIVKEMTIRSERNEQA